MTDLPPGFEVIGGDAPPVQAMGPNGVPRIMVTPQNPYADAISGIESSGNYHAIGPVTRNGDRALGKYQVMSANVPAWTQEVFGQALTPQQFLSSPEVQDAVFNAKFGSYVQKYGPEGAARAWFAGEGGMNDPNRRDVLGTSVADYGNRFMAGMGDGQTMAFAGEPQQPQFPPQAMPQIAQAPQVQSVTQSMQSTGLPPGFEVMQEQSSAPVTPPPAQPHTTGMQAFGRGVAQGATFNFYDELRGLMEAGGLNPNDPASLNALVQGAYKYFTGDRGAANSYDAAVARERGLDRTAQQEHPIASTAGSLGGAIALPLGAALNGATLPARIGRGAAVGAATGAAYGAGEGTTPEERAGQALVGGGLGAAAGAIAPPIVEGGARLAGAALSRPITIARSAINPEGAAVRAVGRAYRDAAQSDPNAASRLNPTELSAGSPAMVLDTLGGQGRDLARSAANLSGEARDTLNASLNDRFVSQAGRFTDWLNKTFNFPNAHAQQEAIDQVAKTVNTPAYRKAYADGAKGVWDPELARIAAAPSVQKAIGGAVPPMKDRGIIAGFKLPRRNPFTVDPRTGAAVLRKNASGNVIVPELAFWDQIVRNLSGRIGELLRSGNDTRARDVIQLKNALVRKLDELVPSYKQARAGAASFFGAENAVEAGQNFVSQDFAAPAARAALAKMSPLERQLFQDGFVSRYIETINKAPDRADVVRRIYNSPAAREKIRIAVGPKRADELEAVLRVEGIMQSGLRAVQGNSTTAQQLAQLGLAGAAGGAAGAAGGGALGYDPTISGIVGALSAAGKRGVDRRVAEHVARMLVSKDPKVLDRGIKMIANSKTLMAALRSADAATVRASGSQIPAAAPVLQLPAPGRANDQQPAVPRPPAN